MSLPLSLTFPLEFTYSLLRNMTHPTKRTVLMQWQTSLLYYFHHCHGYYGAETDISTKGQSLYPFAGSHLFCFITDIHVYYFLPVFLGWHDAWELFCTDKPAHVNEKAKHELEFQWKWRIWIFFSYVPSGGNYCLVQECSISNLENGQEIWLGW